MYIVCTHRITDQERFWETARSVVTTGLPEGIALHQTLPNGDGSLATCLWEAPTLDAVQSFVDTHVGGYSTNDYYAVNDSIVMGLPK
jgi:hypothetical protein